MTESCCWFRRRTILNIMSPRWQFSELTQLDLFIWTFQFWSPVWLVAWGIFSGLFSVALREHKVILSVTQCASLTNCQTFSVYENQVSASHIFRVFWKQFSNCRHFRKPGPVVIPESYLHVPRAVLHVYPTLTSGMVSMLRLSLTFYDKLPRNVSRPVIFLVRFRSEQPKGHPFWHPF